MAAKALEWKGEHSGSAGSLKDGNNQNDAVLCDAGPRAPALPSRRLRRPDLPEPPAPGNPGTLPGLLGQGKGNKEANETIHHSDVELISNNCTTGNRAGDRRRNGGREQGKRNGVQGGRKEGHTDGEVRGRTSWAHYQTRHAGERPRQRMNLWQKVLVGEFW